MGECIEITATDSTGSVIGETTLEVDCDPDALAARSGDDDGSSLLTTRRTVLGATLAGLGLASGTASAADRSLRIVGSGSYAEYDVAVSGSIDGGDVDDTTGDSTASGQVTSWSDSYRFSGEITSFSLSGDATVYVDGEQVRPASLGSDTTTAWRMTGIQTSDYAAADHDIVLADASDGAVTVTLPAPTRGRAMQVKKVDATDNPVRLTAGDGVTIDGATERTITGQHIARTARATDAAYYYF